MYGHGKRIIKTCFIDPLGIPHVTDANVGYFTDVQSVRMWHGVNGVASLSYPHPISWTFAEVESGTPLHQLEVRDLTRAISLRDEDTPSCIHAWNDIYSSWHITAQVDWEEYGRSYGGRLATNKDNWPHFKYILHRKLVLRCFCPSESGSDRCRCCGRARETHNHLVRCHVLWEVWKPFRRLSNSIWKHNNISNELIFLAITSSGELLPHSLLVLHRIMWKIVIIALTQAEFDNIPVKPKHIWNMLFRRYTKKVRALHRAHCNARCSALTFRRQPPSPDSINKFTNPIADCDANGTLTWSQHWVALGRDYDVTISRVSHDNISPQDTTDAEASPSSKAAKKGCRFVPPTNYRYLDEELRDT